MHFDFRGFSGFLAFSGASSPRLLLLTDAGHGAVHAIDVSVQAHVGYVAAPGTLSGPRGVAARGSLVAVSTWETAHVVRVFEGSGATWAAVREVAGGFGAPGSADGQLHCPYGLRFTNDGTALAVADADNHRVSVFRVEDGSFVRHDTAPNGPVDVENCEDGWLVSCRGSHTVEHVRFGGGRCGRLAWLNTDSVDLFWPAALTLVPALGLVVRDLFKQRVCVLATPDALAMARMSLTRVGWMAAVLRGTLQQWR
jgi:hypothetical protein